eukprot:CAMPEP_0197837388 /NCGR_PEP_ID=MMETSP1437-20131217/31996_1 /TAXON_ID=49252 ORGANISM="Eucampia antarctica, Strain CCMP1452" /NCGR_SAMPLE_ID=MMETSP1437 /ASSEMBLY_ACC=CAM_ASM_001096 /LENGTH=105 /DNA_ID=CAMNT_0043444397 /DNA_START=32 /DNA_END=349 /DNA_ORIENTATION=+
MALSIANHFYFEVQEAKVPCLIADLAMAVAFHFVERSLRAEKKLRQYEEAKKNDEVHELKKADTRGTKSKNILYQKQNHVRAKDYKTTEKRQHAPQRQNIQKPKK